MMSIKKIFFIWFVGLLNVMAVTNHAVAADFLSPEKAFQVIAETKDDANVHITVKPVDGYYVYKESIKFKLLNPDKQELIGLPVLPKGKIKFDENFGKELETYPKSFQITLPVDKELIGKGFFLQMELQGCADKGICYPPMQLNFTLSATNVVVAGIMPEEAETSVNSGGLSALWAARDDAGQLSKLLVNVSSWILLGSFFILGLAMALTPCVLPMLPIMSSVVFGSKTKQHKNISKTRATILAITYVLGMALMYSIAGMVTAALGANIQAYLQNPWVLSLFSLMLLALAASLFGFYELRLPQSIHNKIDSVAGRQEGGSLIGSFLLGAISTLIASPCVTAPLAGVLAFIAHTGSVPLGGLLLFIMAIGMGLPLMLFAIGAKGLLPRAGSWMLIVQKIFGVLLVALAVWVASPIFMSTTAQRSEATHQLSSGLVFNVVTTSSQLEAAWKLAKENKQLVLLDFYADWCVTCKEMEVLTFNEKNVANKLAAYQLIQVDVTKNTADHQAILKRYALFGPPAILFFDRSGQEQVTNRVIGFMKPERFLERLE